jgi:hypothetical protein
MTDITDIVLLNINKIAGTILLLAVAAFIFWRISSRKRGPKVNQAVQAADIFRDKVTTELKGLYPVPKHWEESAFERFSETVPNIESAAAEFRRFLSSDKKKPFDTALKNYCEHCNSITWESCVTFGIIPDKRKPEDEGPKDIFRQNVNTLLAFTKRT